MYRQTLQFDPVLVRVDQLLWGAWLTIQLTAEAVLLGMAIAVVCAWGKTAGPRPVRVAVQIYVEVIRNTPFLLQLYFFFFGLPSAGIRLNPTSAALLTMAINLGAYATEIVRAGIDAVPHGQTEAARSLGLRPLQIYRKIVMPPALRIIYPPLAGQFTLLLLGSSVVSAISANELTSAANLLQSINFRTFETYVVVTIIYLVLAFAFRALFAGIYWFAFERGREPETRGR
jgi:polar amino acid transport system permease protein